MDVVVVQVNTAHVWNRRTHWGRSQHNQGLLVACRPVHYCAQTKESQQTFDAFALHYNLHFGLGWCFAVWLKCLKWTATKSCTGNRVPLIMNSDYAISSHQIVSNTNHLLLARWHSITAPNYSLTEPLARLQMLSHETHKMYAFLNFILLGYLL